MQNFFSNHLRVNKKSVTFAADFDKTTVNRKLSNSKFSWAVLHGQLPRNPPGWEHSKGTWL